ncbi:MAG: hypothetical protein ABIQ93_13805, partial [Saprospiraceae bacterium]
MATMALLVGGLFAREPNRPGHSPTSQQQQEVQNRAELCANSLSAIDQEINNVRARLLGGGDCWWNLTEGRYIVPKVDVSSGAKEVSSLFAGSVWIGGKDSGNNLKLACQTYRSNGKNDFWPGPLRDADGATDAATCKNWDFHFRVTGADIRKHLRNLAEGNMDPNSIPRSLRGWPSQGNQYFSDVWGFDLPFSVQGLAGFYDANDDQVYNPLDGDYPSIEIRGCPLDRYPDEMIFWIYNDEGAGGVHASTGGKTIRMEVQVQAFGYATNDELNDMTFQRYKLINRANDVIDSTFFAMWVDPDLGCAFDDYIGCDTSRSLMVVYNQDAQDGNTGTTCQGGTNTYGTNVPILGVDYFRGPLDTFGEELGMSSFMYYNNGSGTPPPPMGTDDPGQDQEYYYYITGRWRDGKPLTFGGNGRGGTMPTKYAFPDQPNDAAGWSMCSENLSPGDRRTIQASGPFTLKPGAVNELIIGVPWVADIDYPCPSFDDIFRADQLAQGLFNTCFKLLDGPDAPDVDWIELNHQVVAVLSNSKPSNNFMNENEDYSEEDPLADLSLPKDDRSYKFEGYKIFQLIDPNVSGADFGDVTKSKLVYEVDVKNGIKKIYNWRETRDPATGDRLFYPEIQVDGADAGIRHTFSITEDQFASGNNKTLINHKKYYFAAIAYAYNNYLQFEPLTVPVKGQNRPYLPGRKAGDGGQIRTYTVIPRPIVDRSLQASYGDGVVITRLEGAGTGNNFLDLSEETLNSLWNGTNPDTVLTYKQGRGPITVNIFNPFEVRDGEYEVRLVDGNLTDTKLDANAHWELRQLPNGPVVASQRSLEQLNEQIVSQYGFSLTVAQAEEPGDKVDAANGAIGAELVYADPRKPWLRGYADEDFGIFDWVHNDSPLTEPKVDPEYDYDPAKGLSAMGNGWFVPYALANWRLDSSIVSITPAWTEKGAGSQGILNQNAVNSGTPPRYANLRLLPNVDIVFTKDKSRWSRCPVVETASYFYTNNDINFPHPTDAAAYKTQSPTGSGAKTRVMFDVRFSPSVGKEDANNDGLPDPDGSVYPADGTGGVPTAYEGKPELGMGWFPGYAIDVETGTRLNIFFGENSAYAKSDEHPDFTGRDMLWDPTDAFVTDPLGNIPISSIPPFSLDYYQYLVGGQHWIYVMRTPYDEGVELRNRLTPEFASNAVAKVQQISKIAWTAMLQLAPGYNMNSLNEGLIPNETTIKLRVGNRYQNWYNDNDNKKLTGHPVYRFKIEGREAKQLAAEQIDNSLDSIKMVPNPYYGYSQYESSQFSNIVKITNLPAKCTVTIYSLDGKFIRQYQRDEQYGTYQQITPALEWDLKNSKGIPVASGVYL